MMAGRIDGAGDENAVAGEERVRRAAPPVRS